MYKTMQRADRVNGVNTCTSSNPSLCVWEEALEGEGVGGSRRHQSSSRWCLDSGVALRLCWAGVQWRHSQGGLLSCGAEEEGGPASFPVFSQLACRTHYCLSFPRDFILSTENEPINA